MQRMTINGYFAMLFARLRCNNFHIHVGGGGVGHFILLNSNKIIMQY